jgi:single-stranded DNA-binding protein
MAVRRGHGCRLAQVVGRLKTEAWTDKEGQSRKGFKIVADQINRVRPYAAQVLAFAPRTAPAWRATASNT